MAVITFVTALLSLRLIHSSLKPNELGSRPPHTLIIHSQPQHVCLNLGEVCSLDVNTKHNINSMGPCCDRSTRCKVTGYNEYGFQSGTCCIKSRFDGCTQNSDCCDDRDICINGKCELDIPQKPVEPSTVPNKASSAMVAPFDSVSHGPIINDNEYIHHRNNKGSDSKNISVPHLWRTVSYGVVICVFMSMMLVMLFCALCKRNYNGYRKQFSISEVSSDVNGGHGIVSDIIDCDLIENSDNTDTENESESDHDFDDSESV